MLNPEKFKLAFHPIPDEDQRISRIIAEHGRTGQVTTAGLLFTGGRHEHDAVQRDLLRLADAFGLPGGHWHRQNETDGIPVFCHEPDPDGEEAWLKFAADYGVPRDLAATTLLARPGSTASVSDAA